MVLQESAQQRSEQTYYKHADHNYYDNNAHSSSSTCSMTQGQGSLADINSVAIYTCMSPNKINAAVRIRIPVQYLASWY